MNSALWAAIGKIAESDPFRSPSLSIMGFWTHGRLTAVVTLAPSGYTQGET